MLKREAVKDIPIILSIKKPLSEFINGFYNFFRRNIIILLSAFL